MRFARSLIKRPPSFSDIAFVLRAVITRPQDIPGILRREAAKRRAGAAAARPDPLGLNFMIEAWEAAAHARTLTAPAWPGGPLTLEGPITEPTEAVSRLQTADRVRFSRMKAAPLFPALALEARRLNLTVEGEDPQETQAAIDIFLAGNTVQEPARSQLAALAGRKAEPVSPEQDNRPHLLVGNIFFSPRSFGGATVVAEEVTRRLMALGWRVTILSFSWYGNDKTPSLCRTRTKEGADHFTINVSGSRTPDDEFEMPAISALLRELVQTIKPDAAHLHCVQALGVGLIDALDEAGVPMLLSTHDYWWLCEKIFMLNHMGKFCGQDVIDKKICASCVLDRTTLDARWSRALETLAKPAAITYPSHHARHQHEINGVDPSRGHVLPNGVIHPGSGYDALRKARPSSRLRFGYIGGPGPLKGWAMIERAFRDFTPEEVELVVVDAATHLGGSWWKTYEFGPIAPLVTVVPGYSMETVDPFFADLDVLLFLSTWKETFGLTAREAALRDVHVLATDCGAPVEHLTHGETATILPGFGSAPALRTAVRRLLDDGVPTPGDTARAKVMAEVKTYEEQAQKADALLRMAMR